MKEQKKVEIVEAKKQNEIKKDKVTLIAVENTFLADGTFIAKGEKVEVSKEYADRVERENNKSLKIYK